MGEYLDQFLQPLAQKCSAYLKDSKDQMELLQVIKVDEECILASIPYTLIFSSNMQ